MMLAKVLVLFAALPAPSQILGGAGTIAGCVRDVTGEAIPGATIAARARGIQRTTTSDRSGCFELRELAPGPYRVAATLTGFQNFTQDPVLVSRGSVTRLALTLAVAPRCDCVHTPPPKTLAEAWGRGDGAMHIQILSGESYLLSSSMYYRHDVRVLHSFPRGATMRRIGGATTSVLEMQFGGSPEPYEPRKELVIFPTWLPQANAFVGLGTTGPSCCNNASTVFEVESKRISSAPEPLTHYVGMPIDAFLQELQALSLATGK
jgi:hypothetical protein